LQCCISHSLAPRSARREFWDRLLGKDDHIVHWQKPSSIRHLDWASYKQLPDYLEIRETRIRVVQPGFRTKEIVVVTTLLDPEAATKEDLASLYRSRWSQEVYQPECTSSVLLYQVAA
jgi:hypothetical protein